MTNDLSARRFVLCLKNERYPASLDVRKVYESLPDPLAESKGLVRVVDESGEDYLYPAEYFVPIELPATAAAILAEHE